MSSCINIFGVLILITIIISVAAAVADTSSIKPKLAVDPPSLDVMNLDQTRYEKFIEDCREYLTNKKDPPVLPPATNPPQWFDLKLTAGAEETTVRIQKNNLYVVGYQAQTPKQMWFELARTNDENHAITGSVFLGYRGDYGDLQGAAGKSVTKVSLTKIAFKKAVLRLANSKIPKESTTKENQERAQALILIVQMVSEACRFVDISNHIASNIHISDKDIPIQPWMFFDLEKNWDKFSTYVLSPGSFRPPTINGEVIDSVEKLREKLGVILNVKKSVKQPRKIDDDDVDDELPNIIDVQAQLQHAEPAVLEA